MATSTNLDKIMPCTPSHQVDDLYFVSGNITHENLDQSGQYPCLAKHSHHANDLYDMSGNKIQVYLVLSRHNPCLAHIHIMVMICAMCLVN